MRPVSLRDEQMTVANVETISESITRRLPSIGNMAFVILVILMPGQIAHLLAQVPDHVSTIVALYTVLFGYAAAFVVIRQNLSRRLWIDGLISLIAPLSITYGIIRAGGNALLPIIGCGALVASLAIIIRMRRFVTTTHIAVLWVMSYLLIIVATYISPIWFPRQLGSVIIIVIGIGQL